MLKPNETKHETLIDHIVKFGLMMQLPRVNSPTRKFINHLEFERVKCNVKEAIGNTIERIASKI